MIMNIQFLGWRADADVYGEAAGLAFAGHVVDLVVTYRGDGGFEWEVVDGTTSTASGTATSASEARRAAEAAGRRAFIHAA